MITWCI